MAAGVVIVGAGFAGATAAIALRNEGFHGQITIVGAESVAPYNRPPLSKTYLRSDGPVNELYLRPDEFWSEQRIDLRTSTRVTHVDRAESEVLLDNGSRLAYDDLILATGAEPREITVNRPVLKLRSWEDAIAVRTQLRPGQRIAIVGGGFIGLELAVAAVSMGAQPFIVEAAPRLLERALSVVMAEHLRNEHERHGVIVHLGRSVDAATDSKVVLDDGRELPADAVVVGVGVTPRTALAAAAGLEVADGIVVDSRLRTSDLHIWAVGDCASYRCFATGRQLRIESIQNATDQARYVARAVIGSADADFTAVPWFWTEQYSKKLLIAGVAAADSTSVLRGSVDSGEFSVCRFDSSGRCIAVESIGRPSDHLAARKLLATDANGFVLSRADAADLQRPLGPSTTAAHTST